MSLKIGDRVTVIDEDLNGVIRDISTGVVSIETEDGFRLSYGISEVVLQRVLTPDVFAGENINQIIRDKEFVKSHKSIRVKPKERNLPTMEVDLHIEQITTRYQHLSNFDILNMQLDTAKHKLEFALKKRIQKIVFIHGVGDGVLKSELEYLFRRYSNVSYYPADYQKYGQGATEVYVKQKATP